MTCGAFATFHNSKFWPYNSFKAKCVGLNQYKVFVESLYNQDLALLVALWTPLLKGGTRSEEWGDY